MCTIVFLLRIGRWCLILIAFKSSTRSNTCCNVFIDSLKTTKTFYQNSKYFQNRISHFNLITQTILIEIFSTLCNVSVCFFVFRKTVHADIVILSKIILNPGLNL